MTYKETKEHGANCVIYTSYYGFGNSATCLGSEINQVTDNEFFTKDEAEQRIKELIAKGYVKDPNGEYEIEDVYTYELWDDACDYLNDCIKEEEEDE